MQYYIGLSILSTAYDTGSAHAASGGHRRKLERQRFRSEARRILSLLEGRLLEKNDMVTETQGRPYFPGRTGVDFNIAHSGLLTAVSHVKGENLRTGCDIERIRARAGSAKIAEEFFSAPEKSYIFPQGVFNEVRFYEIWTLKESFLKLRGLPIFDMADCPSFISAEGVAAVEQAGADADARRAFAFGAKVSSPTLFCLYELSGYMGRYIMAAALEGGEQQPPEIRWFSHLSLTCKKTTEIKARP